MIYLLLFWTFFKIGALTFGGGYAMLPYIQAEVPAHGWLTNEELINFIAVSESTPGPFAVNIATYVGTEVAGVFGAACTTLGVVLPSFLIIIPVAKFYERFQKASLVSDALSGIRPVVIGLIAAALFSMCGTLFTTVCGNTSQLICSVAILALTAVLLFVPKKKINPILIICIAACLGIAVGYTFNL